MKSEAASLGFASASDSFSSESASFLLQLKYLHQHLMHWNLSMQVFPVSKGDHFLPAALAEAGLEIAFKVGWSVGRSVH